MAQQLDIIALERATRVEPTVPSLILATAQGPRLEQFDDLAALGRRIVDLAAGRALLPLRATFATFSGFDTFPAFTLAVAEPGGGRDWLGCAAIQGRRGQELVAAVNAGRERPRPAAEAAR